MAVMLNGAAVIALVATTNPDAARRFYEDVLGLAFVEDSAFALVFAAGAAMLRIQKVRDFTPHPFTALGWGVLDIAETASALTAQGVTLERFGFLQQDDAGIWTAPNGDKVAWFKDPDGNTLSLTQFG
jgi:catechol 2,3-dioxygenase-like lactoylglutathione lyase family enzyme